MSNKFMAWYPRLILISCFTLKSQWVVETSQKLRVVVAFPEEHLWFPALTWQFREIRWHLLAFTRSSTQLHTDIYTGKQSIYIFFFKKSHGGIRHTYDCFMALKVFHIITLWASLDICTLRKYPREWYCDWEPFL